MFRVLNYFKYLLVSVSAVSGCVSLFVFALSLGVPARITSSVV